MTNALRRAGLLSDLFEIPVLGKGEEGWSSAQSLFQDNDDRLRALVMAYGRDRWGTDNCHVAGSAFLIAYLTRLIWPVAAQYVLKRRVPDVRLANLAFHWREERIDGTALASWGFATLAGTSDVTHPDTLVMGNETELYAQLKEWLFEENLNIVVPSLRRSAKASLKVSWNAVAASFSQAFHNLYEASKDPDAVVSDAAIFFEDPATPIYRQVSMEVVIHQGRRGFFSRRAGCCLWWRADRSNEYCSNCILLTRDEQDRVFRRILETRQ